MNIGNIPSIISPFNKPKIWTENEDCLFIDAEEASQEQLQFIKRSKIILEKAIEKNNKAYIARQDNKKGDYKYESLEKRNGVFHKNIITNEQANYIRDEDDALMFNIPHKFKHVNLENLLKSPKEINQLSSVLERIHPWSSINYGFSASDILVKMYVETIPKYLYQNIEIQILSPMTKGSLGTIMLNKRIQLAYNPPSSTKKEIIVSDKIFRIGDRVIQKKNNYELEIFNGDIGRIIDINTSNYSVVVVFGKKDDAKEIVLGKINLADLDLAYAITIHKSQGSEFDVVIIPLSSQHYNMLFRNLIYTAITRAKKMALFVGSRYALAQAIRNQDNSKRQTMLKQLLTI